MFVFNVLQIESIISQSNMLLLIHWELCLNNCFLKTCKNFDSSCSPGQSWRWSSIWHCEIGIASKFQSIESPLCVLLCRSVSHGAEPLDYCLISDLWQGGFKHRLFFQWFEKVGMLLVIWTSFHVTSDYTRIGNIK